VAPTSAARRCSSSTAAAASVCRAPSCGRNT
jgi:hypothetical protein